MLNDNNAILLNQMKKDPKDLYTIKTQDEIEKMRIAGKIAAMVLDDLGQMIKPGVTTRQLERTCYDLIVNKYGAEIDRSNLEGEFFDEVSCMCYARNQILGFAPVDDQPLKKGEIFDVDISLKKDGWCADTSRVWIVGDETSPRLRRLVAVGYEAMWIGIRLVKPGVHLGTIAHAVQTYVESQGFSMVRISGMTSHTIGRVHCEGLLIPFYGAEPNTGHILQKGMTLSIEPAIATGDGLGDRLNNPTKTFIMRDNQFCCHWEHILAVTDDGYDILDLRDGESYDEPKDSFGYVPKLE